MPSYINTLYSRQRPFQQNPDVNSPTESYSIKRYVHFDKISAHVSMG